MDKKADAALTQDVKEALDDLIPYLIEKGYCTRNAANPELYEKGPVPMPGHQTLMRGFEEWKITREEVFEALDTVRRRDGFAEAQRGAAALERELGGDCALAAKAWVQGAAAAKGRPA